MREVKKSLEDEAKDFLKLRIKLDPNNIGFNPIEIENLCDYTDKINYLVKKGYLLESKDPLQHEITVKSLRYKFTSEGKKWALD